jgi:glutathione S-transferase
MVQLADGDIATREVLGWKGLHLFHFMGSSCSQKTRIFLNLKGISWESHMLNISVSENYSAHYLGINPRGLVPTLIIDGEVHIESNDIMTLLEERFPEPKLIPAGFEAEMDKLLHHEDDLHLDVRTITFRFTQPRVLGIEDANKKREIDFWERIARDGITDEAIQVSAGKFRAALGDLDASLSSSAYLLGDDLSVLDIAWFIYTNRLKLCGYPVARLHPRVETWFQGLYARDEFRREIPMDPKIQALIDENHRAQEAAGQTLEQVAGL